MSEKQEAITKRKKRKSKEREKKPSSGLEEATDAKTVEDRCAVPEYDINPLKHSKKMTDGDTTDGKKCTKKSKVIEHRQKDASSEIDNESSVKQEVDQVKTSKSADSAENHQNTESDIKLNFHEMGLDHRLLKAITKLKWPQPTLIQEKAIPLALKGKDILSRARTGSGKTAAYSIPIIQTLLNLKENDTMAKTRSLILVPSKELSEQVTGMLSELLIGCSNAIVCSNLTKADGKDQNPFLNNTPDVVIGTPGRILSLVNAGQLTISEVMWLVIDEADLVLSFGYEEDIRKLVPFLPNMYQTFVTSATFSDDINSLKNLVLKNPVTLQLKESALPTSERLTQYHVICESEDDKYLLLYALLKLRLLQGKTIIFVNTVTRCYRVKLFLEQFSIFCCVLNSELPVTSRCHTVDQFNKGLYDYIIAADESQLLGENMTPQAKSKKNKIKLKEFSVSRGVDFHKVSNVLNFDFPESVQAYIHRVGRTARGYATGTALSFVTGDEIALLENAQMELGEENSMRPYQFAMKEIEGLRYRCRDAMRIVTKQAIKDARLRELRTEMLNSEKLQAYFEQNPRDLQILRHNTALRPSKVKPHMKHVPDYLIPDPLKGIASQRVRKRRAPSNNQGSMTKSRLNPKYKKRQEDPLRSFKFVKPGGK